MWRGCRRTAGTAGWVLHSTVLEVVDAVLNKVCFPVGNTFLQHELDRKVFFDLRGGEVVAVEVFDKGDIRGGQKSMTAVVLCCDYEGYVCAKGITVPALQRLYQAAKVDMSTSQTALQVREEAAVHDLQQAPVELSKLQEHIQSSADVWLEELYVRLVRRVAQNGRGIDPTKLSKSGWFEPAHLRSSRRC